MAVLDTPYAAELYPVCCRALPHMLPSSTPYAAGYFFESSKGLVVWRHSCMVSLCFFDHAESEPTLAIFIMWMYRSLPLKSNINIFSLCN